jgi:hypothetical protein
VTTGQDYAEAVAAAQAFYGVDRTAATESLQWQREQKPPTAGEWRELAARVLKTGQDQ